MQERIEALLTAMADYLSCDQIKKLQETAVRIFSAPDRPLASVSNEEYMQMFLDAKSIEGCSQRTIKFYQYSIMAMFKMVTTPVRSISTEEMRRFMTEYQREHNCSKVTLNNYRRNLNSFFAWLEEENHILKSPMKRIHNIKTNKVVKEVISEEQIEKLRDACGNLRDLAILDLLYSSGMRIGELVNLNRRDINLDDLECVVFGKGGKERRAYFDAKTKHDLEKYLASRDDDDPALFVSLDSPHVRLALGRVEQIFRELGRACGIRLHPHKLRRSMATRALNKGMPIEQVQKLLGHNQLDTTLIYAQVSQDNVKSAHQRYLG